MSATGRKKHMNNAGQEQRDPFDFYPTPSWCVHRFLEAASKRLPVGDWIEPTAGDGAIIRSVKSFGNGYETVKWHSVEIQDRFENSLKEISQEVFIGDYANYNYLATTNINQTKAKVCITNPPYKEAEKIIKQAKKHSNTVAMLLRLNFLASERRQKWIKADTPDVFVLPNRPSFRGKGSDATEYAWFVWDTFSTGKIIILDLTPKSVRQMEKRTMLLK